MPRATTGSRETPAQKVRWLGQRQARRSLFLLSREGAMRHKRADSFPAMHSRFLLAVAALCALFTSSVRADVPPLPTSHTDRKIEGWTVRVDDRLLSGEGAVSGELALKLLSARLLAITLVVHDEQLAKLREVPIQLDLTHGELHSMQYHPDAGWLRSHGYSDQLAKCVHIPDVAHFFSRFESHRQPWATLHELAHAYHDRVLGFDEPRIRAAWEKFRDSGKYKSVVTSPGGMREHYALTNEREFFAEMTESYLGTNDFFPFVAGELKQVEPEIFALMETIWGPLPGRK